MGRMSDRSLFSEIASTLVTYVGGQLIVAFACTCLYLLGFGLLGVPFWFLLAPVCGLLHLVPHFGAIFAILLGLAISLAGGIGWERTLGVTGVFVAVMALENYLLSPLILGKRLRLRPLWVFLAALLGGAVFGFVGLLLAVPALAVAMAVYRRLTPRPN